MLNDLSVKAASPLNSRHYCFVNPKYYSNRACFHDELADSQNFDDDFALDICCLNNSYPWVTDTETSSLFQSVSDVTSLDSLAAKTCQNALSFA